MRSVFLIWCVAIVTSGCHEGFETTTFEEIHTGKTEAVEAFEVVAKVDCG
jgi:hypothetical protein